MVIAYRKDIPVNPNLPQSGKKPYNTPVVKLYGDIRVIMQRSSNDCLPQGRRGLFPRS